MIVAFVTATQVQISLYYSLQADAAAAAAATALHIVKHLGHSNLNTHIWHSNKQMESNAWVNWCKLHFRSPFLLSKKNICQSIRIISPVFHQPSRTHPTLLRQRKSNGKTLAFHNENDENHSIQQINAVNSLNHNNNNGNDVRHKSTLFSINYFWSIIDVRHYYDFYLMLCKRQTQLFQCLD